MFLTAGTASLATGGSETYTLQVANNASADPILVGTPITVTDTVPMGFSNVSASASSGWSFTTSSTTSPSTVTATYTGEYPVTGGQFLPSITLTGTATGAPTGSISDSATVAVAGDSNPANNTATTIVTVTAPVTNPDVTTSLAVVGGPTFTVGDTVTVNDTIFNTGNGFILFSASGVQATINVPAGMTNVTASGTNWTITTSSTTSPSTVTATYIGGPIFPAMTFPVITLTGTLGAAAAPSFAITAGVTDSEYSSDLSTTSSTIDVAAATTPSALTVAAASGIYGGTASLSATLTSASLPVVGELVVFHIGATYLGTATTVAGGIATLGNAALGWLDAGTYVGDITATFAGDLTFGTSTGTADLTVTPAPLVVTADAQTKEYGQANPTLTGTLNGVLNSDAVSVNYGTTAGQYSDVQAGGYAIIQDGLSGAKAMDYSLTVIGGSYTPAALTIIQAPLTVTANSQSKVYGQANPTLTGTLTGVLNSDAVSASFTTAAVQYSDVLAGGYPISYSALAGAKAGDYVVSSIANNYLTVTPAPLTVVVDAQTKVYGQANPTLTGTLTGMLNGDAVSATFTTNASQYSDVVAVPYSITYSALAGAKAVDYTVTSSTPADLTVTPAPVVVVANSASKVYGHFNPEITGTLTGLLNGDSASANYATTAVQYSDVQAGGYPITISGLVGPKALDYSTTVVGGSSTTGTLTITPAPLIVSGDTLSKVYGQFNPTLTGTALGIFNNDDVSAAYAATTTQFSDVQAGGYATTFTGLVGAKAIDYSTTVAGGSSATGTLTITPAPVVVFADAKSKVYGQANPTLTGGVDGLFNSDDVSANFATTAGQYSDVQAGGYPISFTNLTGTKAIDYSTTVLPGFSVPSTLTVTPAPLVVVADGVSKVYGQAIPTLTGTVTGLLNGDALTVNYVTSAGQFSHVQAGGYAITFGGLLNGKAQDYSTAVVGGSFTPATLTVTQAPLVVEADPLSKVYGQANPTLTGTVLGIINTDDVVDHYATAATQFSDVQAGGYAITFAGLTGADALDYSLTVAGGSYIPAALTITPAPVGVEGDAQSKVYGQANPTLTGSVFDLLNGDVVGASYATAATQYSDVQAGGYATTLTALTGAKAIDYSTTVTGGSFEPGLLTVTPAPLSVAVSNLTKVYGQANPSFSSATTGIVNGDDVAIDFTTTATQYSDVQAGGYPISFSGLSGTKAADYSFPGTVNATLTVAPAPLTIIIDNLSKVYGHTNPELGSNIGGVLNGDDVSPNLATAAAQYSDVQAGGYAIIVDGLSGAKAADYSTTVTGASVTSGILTITPAPLHVLVADQSRVYGQANPTATGVFFGALNGDVVQLAYGTTATQFSDVVAGGYPILPTSLSGAKAADYSFSVEGSSVTPGTLTVAPAPLAIVANDVGRSYGLANPTLSGTSAGILNGDDVSFVLSTTATPSSDVVAGGYPIAVTGLSGAKAGDYAIANPTAGTLTVTPAPLTIAAENQDKVYGQANAPFTASYDGFVLGQDASVLSGTLGFGTTVTAASHVGTYSIVPSGLTSGNYAIDFTDGSLSVSPATLTVTPVDATKPFGAALPVLSANYSGFVNGDTTASLTIPVALSTTATAGSASGTYPIIASGGSSPDYTIVHGQGTLTVSAATRGTGSGDPAESAFITSLYQNLLGRAPAGIDLSAWLAQLDGGASESDVTSLIYNSAEAASFRATQGLPTNPKGAEQITLVTSLYQNLLGRAPEAAGLDAWLAQLDAGTSASDVAAMIGGSPEAIADHGSQSTPIVPGAAAQATLVTSLYQNILGRAPEAAGLDAWLAQLDAGTGASSVAAMINNSPEAIADRATQSPSASPGQVAFVNALYEVLFGRDPEPLGLNGWTSLLVEGTTRADVAEGVYHSPEANALHSGNHHGPTITEPDALAYALNAQKKLGQA